MADPMVAMIGHVEGLDGTRIHVGTDYDAVTVRTGGLTRLSHAQAESFALLFVRACWEAGANARRMEDGDG